MALPVWAEFAAGSAVVTRRAWRGDRRITLHEHPPAADDAAGFPTRGDPIDHVVWATRHDRTTGDSQQQVDETETGRWHTRFRVRQVGLAGLAAGGTAWTLTDEYGRAHDLVRVGEPPETRGRWWDLYAVARIPAVAG